ncbi:aldehyde dehydrogenase family protein [Nocardioides sp. WS12]|uniref:aldehyde dehydrogenase family protein n=1 Tax=Nocardioides sp. WS12 TaxID=2486272 RepID=UPI0015FBF337|nr:aldehyde dehydrogenase family protein [Nocardioides sp. WS12]
MTVTTIATTGNSAELLDVLGERFGRNHIAGRWQFPAAPYEFEIRNPADSTIVAVVPLSSRFDVADAVEAARASLSGWADRGARVRAVRRLLDELAVHDTDLAALQAAESGLDLSDSLTAVRVTLSEARAMLRCEAVSHLPQAGGVSGHILSWGLPFNEVITSVIPALLAGDAVVIKPSLRAPLSAAAFAHFASIAGFEPGVVNVVQGTGGDVGAELISRADLSGLHVRASERVIKQAHRARTNVPLHSLRAGGNTIIVGPGAEHCLEQVADAAVQMVRLNNAGGPHALGTLAVHATLRDSLVAALVEKLRAIVPAPLPTEGLRLQAMRNLTAQVDAGAHIETGGTDLPDDIQHRMAWRMLPTLLGLGPADSAAHRVHSALDPFGPTLGVLTFTEESELEGAFAAARYADGVARLVGFEKQPQLPHGLIVGGPNPDAFDSAARLAPTWLGPQ